MAQTSADFGFKSTAADSSFLLSATDLVCGLKPQGFQSRQEEGLVRSSLVELKGSWNYFSYRLCRLPTAHCKPSCRAQVVLKYETLFPLSKKQESAFGVSGKDALIHGQQTGKQPTFQWEQYVLPHMMPLQC